MDGGLAAAQIIISELESIGELTDTDIAPTAPVTTVTSQVTITGTTGLAVAAYTSCQGAAGPCKYQWELFPLQTTNLDRFPGCSTDGALYSSVVANRPEPTAIPRLGPFSIDNRQDCFFDQNVGLSCVDGAKTVVPQLLSPTAQTGRCDGDGVECSPDGAASYNAQWQCYW